MTYNYEKIADELLRAGGDGYAYYVDEDADITITVWLTYSFSSTVDYFTPPQYSLDNYQCIVTECPDDFDKDMLVETINRKFYEDLYL